MSEFVVEPSHMGTADPFETLVSALADGHLVFFLGAGANLCGRPSQLVWNAGCGYFPNGEELAKSLSTKFDIPCSKRTIPCHQLLSFLLNPKTKFIFCSFHLLFHIHH